MKIECDIIKDLLPLYIEQLTSKASNIAIEEHLNTCEQCNKIYLDMNIPDFQVKYNKEPAESFYKYVKKKKRNLGLKVAVLTAIVVFIVFAIRLATLGLLTSFLALNSETAEVYIDTDASHYLWYIGDNAKEEYTHKWGMDESIFPNEISCEMNVTDYKMVYYNPWDAQYLSYLVVEYNDKKLYEAETKRLTEYPSKEYIGYFGSEGFSEKYTLLAIETHPDFGMIYALSGENNQIIYVELIFCNYFYDIDYKNMIDKEYLPIGFDATKESIYRQKKLKYN